MFDIQWPLVLFSLLAGAGGGALAFAGLSSLVGRGTNRARLVTAACAMVLLVVGGCCSMLHLAFPENVMAAAQNIFSFSGISVELILLGITFIVAAAYAILVARKVEGAAVKAVAALGILFGLLLAFFCGHGYVMPGRPLWETELLPFAYFGTAVATGALVQALIALLLGDEDDSVKALAWWYVGAAVLGLLGAIAYTAFLASAGALLGAAATYGAGAVAFAAVAVVMAVFFAVRKPNAGVASVGAAVAFIAGLLVRMQMWAVSTGYIDLFAVAESTRTWFF